MSHEDAPQPPPDLDVAIVLHDVRNWLMIALSWLDDSLFESAPWPQRQDSARLAVDRAAALVAAQTDHLLQRRAVAPVATLREVITVMSARLGKAIQIRCDLPDDLPDARIAPDALQRIALNLLLNSARAMGPGGGAIHVDAEAVPGWVQVNFRDSGPGLADPVRAFEPGWTATGGRGLGLASARGLATAAGGRLEAVPNPGQGAWFRLCLPR